MGMLSDPDVLPDLINQLYTLSGNATDPDQEATITGQLQELTHALAQLTDVTLNPEEQAYQDAVAGIQAATAAAKKAQATEAAVASAIAKVASVISVLGRLAAVL